MSFNSTTYQIHIPAKAGISSTKGTRSRIKSGMCKVTRGWPPARRKAQATRCRAQKLWQHARGPKTAAGKARSAQNACKHGLRSAVYRVELKRLRENLRAHRAFLSHIKAQAKLLALSTSPTKHETLCRLWL